MVQKGKHVIAKKKKTANWDLDSLSGKKQIENAPETEEQAVKEIAQEYTLEEGSFVVKKLAAKDIAPDPEQPRNTKKLSAEYIEELGENIFQTKQYYPIIVRKNPDVNADEEWMIVDGECRWLGVNKHPQLSELTAIILDDDDLDVTDILLMQIVANDKRKSTTIAEKALSYTKLLKGIKAKGGNQEEAAGKIGIDRTLLSRYKSIAENEKVLDLSIKDVTQDFLALSRLCSICKKDVELGQKTINLIKQGLIKKELRTYLDELLEELNDTGENKKPAKKQPKPKLYKPTKVSHEHVDEKSVLTIEMKGKLVQIEIDEIRDQLVQILNSEDTVS